MFLGDQHSAARLEEDRLFHERGGEYATIRERRMATTTERTKQLLTFSRAQSFKVCRKKHQWEYEMGVRRILDAKALRMGSAYHEGLDFLKRDGSRDGAIEAVRKSYETTPPEYDQIEWEMERETVCVLISGYVWRWEKAGLTWIASEQSFEFPVVNPETGVASRLWNLAGKIDGIVDLEDKRLAVGEHKLISDDLNSDSDWWRRLQLDPQVSIYVYAARKLGHDVATVLYDVARKPSIKPTPVSLLDELGTKVVLDRNGERVKTERGLWRQTGDTEKGYTLQIRPMTVDEWTQKVVDDIGGRPDWYYARREIPRLDDEIRECQTELWDLQKVIREAQVKERWFRTVGRDTCPWCPYFALCTMKFDPHNGVLPEGFQYVVDKHPELSSEGD
jgi:hypothetical protein